MAIVEAQVNGVRVFKDAEADPVEYLQQKFPGELRELVSAALWQASEQGRAGELRILVDGTPRYEFPYQDPQDGSDRWIEGREASAALRRVVRGLRSSTGELQVTFSLHSRRTFDHDLAARLYAVLPDYAAVGRALRVSGDAVRQAIKRNVDGLNA